MSKKLENKAVKKSALSKKKKQDKQQNNELFDYNNEIVIGLKQLPDERDVKKEQKKKTKNKKKNDDKFDQEIFAKSPKKSVKRIKQKKKQEIKTREKMVQRLEKQSQNDDMKRRTKGNKKKQQRRRFIAKFISFTILIILIGVGVIYTLLSPIFNIKKIEVVENQKITKEEAISLSGLQVDTNMFRYQKNDVIEKIKENAYVDTVTIKRLLPDTVQILITERTASFILEYGASYAYMNNQGYILEIIKEPMEGLPKIIGYETQKEKIVPTNRLDEVDLKKLDTILQLMKTGKSSEIAKYISAIDVTDMQDIKIHFQSEGKLAHIGDATNLETKFLYIRVIIEERENGNAGEIFVNRDLNKYDVYFREKI